VHWLTALTTFAVIFPAELPDKSMVATVILGTRFRALPVWLGVTSAFAVHVVFAVTLGSLLHLLPHRVVSAIVAALFALGAVLLVRAPGDDDTEEREAATARRAFLSSFVVVFVGEWGDVTQLATANLAARYAAPLAVGLGAFAALAAVAALAVLLGGTLLRKVPLRLVQVLSAVVLAVLAVVAAVDAVRG
jgi:putative Ca2+/H+ antiporter (TMEM165/GDT1 family)